MSRHLNIVATLKKIVGSLGTIPNMVWFFQRTNGNHQPDFISAINACARPRFIMVNWCELCVCTYGFDKKNTRNICSKPHLPHLCSKCLVQDNPFEVLTELLAKWQWSEAPAAEQFESDQRQPRMGHVPHVLHVWNDVAMGCYGWPKQT